MLIYVVPMIGKEGDGRKKQGWKEDMCVQRQTHKEVQDSGSITGMGASMSQGYRQGAEQLPREGDCGRGRERATIGNRCPQKLMT